MKVLVTGDREWTNLERIAEVLSVFPEDTIIIHGKARGADTIAGLVAEELGFEVRPYPAHWRHTDECPKGCKEMVGRPAGAIRNRKMYKAENPDLVLAFHNNIDESKGTKDMIGVAKKGGTPVALVTDTDYYRNY